MKVDGNDAGANLEIMKNAIIKAVEGGWKMPTFRPFRKYDLLYTLDPEFWQALARALGYDCSCNFAKYKFHADDCKHNEWKKMWHGFIDSLDFGKNPDDYFNDLLKQQ